MRSIDVDTSMRASLDRAMPVTAAEWLLSSTRFLQLLAPSTEIEFPAAAARKEPVKSKAKAPTGPLRVADLVLEAAPVFRRSHNLSTESAPPEATV